MYIHSYIRIYIIYTYVYIILILSHDTGEEGGVEPGDYINFPPFILTGEEGGVQAGDIITAVDGASVHGFTTVSVIRGSTN